MLSIYKRLSNWLIDFYGESKSNKWRNFAVIPLYKTDTSNQFPDVIIFFNKRRTKNNIFFSLWSANRNGILVGFFFAHSVGSLNGSNYDILWKWIWFTLHSECNTKTTKANELINKPNRNQCEWFIRPLSLTWNAFIYFLLQCSSFWISFIWALLFEFAMKFHFIQLLFFLFSKPRQAQNLCHTKCEHSK